jgi:phenylacetate-CoA ligase
MIEYAYDNVPFYHRKLVKAHVKPSDIISLADLSKIPVTTKSEIQSCFQQDLVSRRVDGRRIVLRSTSGSTGIPLVIAVDSKVVDFEGAVWHRTVSQNGLRLRDRMSVIADPRSFPKNRRWIEYLKILKRQYLSVFDPAETQLAFLQQFKPHVIKGYPSSLTILAESCRNGASFPNPRLVFTTSELLDRSSRELITSVFGADLMDNYACHELGLLAWECNEHAGFHINIDSVMLEFIKDDGDAAASSERGQILCTSLFNRVMPLIRYSIGDVGIPVEERCSCGISLPLMKIVEGRTDDFLVSTKGRMISPTVFFPYPFESMRGITQFRVIQEATDRLTIQLVTEEGFPKGDQVLENARDKIQQLFGERMHVDFQMLEKIERDSSGKLRKIVSRIDV